MQRKKKAMESAQEDINAANSRIGELTQQINDLLASNNDILVCLYCICSYSKILTLTFFYFIFLEKNDRFRTIKRKSKNQVCF